MRLYNIYQSYFFIYFYRTVSVKLSVNLQIKSKYLGIDRGEYPPPPQVHSQSMIILVVIKFYTGI